MCCFGVSGQADSYQRLQSFLAWVEALVPACHSVRFRVVRFFPKIAQFSHVGVIHRMSYHPTNNESRRREAEQALITKGIGWRRVPVRILQNHF